MPDRDARLAPDTLAPFGMVGDSRKSTAVTGRAFDAIGARGWSSYGWVADENGPIRRGWYENRQYKGTSLPLAFLSLLTLSSSSHTHDLQRPGGGWLTLAFSPEEGGQRLTMEIRGELDAAMYESVRAVLEDLRVTVIRAWGPTAD
jgi:hypothetical protein